MRVPVGCEYGYPALCGKPATYMCLAPGYPYEMPACDEHAPLMHGFREPPPRCSSYYREIESPSAAPLEDALKLIRGFVTQYNLAGLRAHKDSMNPGEDLLWKAQEFWPA